MKRFLLKFLAFVVLVLIGLYFFNIYVPYSEGFRSGRLIKLSKKGIIFKTWEGELSLGIGHDQRWSFSIEPGDEEVRQQLIDLQGRDVKVHYIERFWKIPWKGKTKYFAKGVEQVRAEGPSNYDLQE